MANATAAQEIAIGAVDYTVPVHLSPTIQREYARRGVFPDLRAASAAERLSSGWLIFRLAPHKAREVLEDAHKFGAYGTTDKLPKGARLSYNSLWRGLDLLMKRQSVADKDPGVNAARNAMSSRSALFHPGDAAIYTLTEPIQLEVPVRVVGEYRVYPTKQLSGGEYRAADGTWISYRPGYLVRTEQGGESVVAAGLLRSVDRRVSHLRRVY